MKVYRTRQKLSQQEHRLIALGILKPPVKKRPASFSWPKPPGNVSDKVMEQVWRDEREGRWEASCFLGHKMGRLTT